MRKCLGLLCSEILWYVDILSYYIGLLKLNVFHNLADTHYQIGFFLNLAAILLCRPAV